MAQIRAILTHDEFEIAKEITNSLLARWKQITLSPVRYAQINNIVQDVILRHNREVPKSEEE